MIVLTNNLNAQLDISSEFYRYSDDNIYNSALKVSDNIYNTSLNGVYNFKSEKNTLQLFNQNSMNYYQENIETSSLFNKFGLADNFQISDVTQINLGINYSLKNNRDVFTLLDYSQISAFGNMRFSFSETDILTAGYIYYFTSFKNFSLFSNTVHKTFLRFNSSFESETSIILSSDISAKLYPAELGNPASEAYQVNLFAQVGQSVAENTGMSLYFQLRNNLSQVTRTFYYDNTLFYQDELFNDVFSNEGYEIGFTFTKLFSQAFGLKGEVSYSNREYSMLPALDFDGNTIAQARIDNQFGIGVEVQQDLSAYLNDLTAHLNWNYLINKSNDRLYKYDNQLLSIGLDYGF